MKCTRNFNNLESLFLTQTTNLWSSTGIFSLDMKSRRGKLRILYYSPSATLKFTTKSLRKHEWKMSQTDLKQFFSKVLQELVRQRVQKSFHSKLISLWYTYPFRLSWASSMERAKGTWLRCGKSARKWAKSSFSLMKLMPSLEADLLICMRPVEEYSLLFSGKLIASNQILMWCWYALQIERRI